VPSEYRNVSMIKNKLPELKMGNFTEDVLFYIFYNFSGEVYQLAAAMELYEIQQRIMRFLQICILFRFKRKWRFHKVRKIWLISPLPLDISEPSIGNLGECLCYIFDPVKWRKVGIRKIILIGHISFPIIIRRQKQSIYEWMNCKRASITKLL
jgi:hypothetical protein